MTYEWCVDSGYRADNPAAVEAYRRASKVTKDIARGVKLSEGQMLIINNNRYSPVVTVT